MSLLDDVISDFELLDEWEDRYRYLIELGRKLEVWVETQVARGDGEPVLTFRGDSDAHIVRGLVCLVLALYSGKSAKEILDTDAMDLFQQLGLTAHLTPQRSNGVRSMVERIKRDARTALAA